MSLLYGTFPPEDRVEVSRILIIPTVIAPATGPVLGGWLVDAFSWHWVFFVNVPIGLLALVFGLIWLKDLPAVCAGRFDWQGFLLAGAGFGFFLYALSEGAAVGWTSAPILAGLLVGVCALVAFILVELNKPEPMIQLRLLKRPPLPCHQYCLAILFRWLSGASVSRAHVPSGSRGHFCAVLRSDHFP